MEQNHISSSFDKDLNKLNDNLLKLEQELSEETVKNIKNQVQLDIQEAVDFAESSEFPKESELLENVYG